MSTPYYQAGIPIWQLRAAVDNMGIKALAAEMKLHRDFPAPIPHRFQLRGDVTNGTGILPNASVRGYAGASAK
jgi:hypothetical protein